MMVPTSVGHQYNVVLPPQLILRDTERGSFGLTTRQQQLQPESQMSSQVYANYAMGPLWWNLLFQS